MRSSISILRDIDLTKNNDGIRILKEQILKLKENEHSKVEHNVGEIPKININSPLYFSIDELIQELKLLNKKLCGNQIIYQLLSKIFKSIYQVQGVKS